MRVTPRAGADRVGPYTDGLLHVRATRPPVDGEANRAVAQLVARALGVVPSRLTLVAGEHSRTKRYAVRDLSVAELHARLATICD